MISNMRYIQYGMKSISFKHKTYLVRKLQTPHEYYNLKTDIQGLTQNAGHRYLRGRDIFFRVASQII